MIEHSKYAYYLQYIYIHSKKIMMDQCVGNMSHWSYAEMAKGRGTKNKYAPWGKKARHDIFDNRVVWAAPPGACFFFLFLTIWGWKLRSLIIDEKCWNWPKWTVYLDSPVTPRPGLHDITCALRTLIIGISGRVTLSLICPPPHEKL